MKKMILFSCILFFAIQGFAQHPQSSAPIIFIYDASGSMWGQIDGTSKMEIASRVLSGAVGELPDEQQIGLVAYGHRREKDCRDVEFLVDPANVDKAMVDRSIASIKPLGRTPLAYSATQVIDKLRQTREPATVILITDGIESSDGNICDVIKVAKAEGIDFRMHIVGFGLVGEETAQLTCAASAGGGHYYNVADAGSLTDGLKEATAATVNDPADNFSVFAFKNGQPIDAYIQAFKPGNRNAVDIARTYRDTAFMYLPPGLYDLNVQPLENSDVEAIVLNSVQSFEDQMAHQTVSFDNGQLRVITLNNGEGWDTLVKIYDKAGTQKAGGRTYGQEDLYDLNAGVYDIELIGLTIEGLETVHRIENVTVQANGVIDAQHNFKTGIAMIGANSAAGLVDAVINIVEKNSTKHVGGGRTYTATSSNPRKFVLTPGTYQVTLNGLGDQAGKTQTFDLLVKEGKTIEKIVSF